MPRRGGLLIGLMVGILALTAAGCGGDGDDGSASATTAAPETTAAPTTTAGGGGGGEDEVQLSASGFAWNPDSLQLTAGSEVRVEVTNEDQATHSFTFAEGSADQDIAGGEDATVTFTAPAAGSYQFRCKFHPAMTGTVTVA
jgi:plastocyanin